ncbi:MAG: lytic transglycosylase domain-containing protein [Bryobacteraceae bacterium]
MKLAAFTLFVVWTAAAGEFAVLNNGARLHAERHEVSGARLTLFTKTGSTELDSSQVVRFEVEDPLPGSQALLPAAELPPKPLAVRELVESAARKYGLPPALVKAVVGVESGFHVDAVSPKGAVGLMQLMPGTAKALGANPKDAVENVDAGTRYLRDLLLKYDGRMFHALAAYNAGPGAVEKYRGIPPYRETQSYILNVWRRSEKEEKTGAANR